MRKKATQNNKGLERKIMIYGAIIITITATSITTEKETATAAIIDLKGVIQSSKSLFSEGATAEEIAETIRKADESPSIDAIVIRINSPGGTPVASSIIADAIKEAKKPTVAWIQELGASGAYWVASSADEIIAHPLSITGSIGVYGSYLDFSGFLEEHNITYQRLVAGEHKDAGSPLRPLTKEEQELLQEKINSIRDYFIKEVAKNRNLTIEEVTKISDGMFLLGTEAKEKGLVDELGGEKEVKKYLEEKLGKKVRFKTITKEKGIIDSLIGIISQHGYSLGQGLGNSLKTTREYPFS